MTSGLTFFMVTCLNHQRPPRVFVILHFIPVEPFLNFITKRGAGVSVTNQESWIGEVYRNEASFNQTAERSR